MTRTSGSNSRVGRVERLFRYPVKSMRGEQLDATQLSPLGVVGDRAWALRDEVRGGIRGAKQLPGLMSFRARYTEEPTDGSAAAEIELPDGTRLSTGAADVNARLSQALDHQVSLWPRLPAAELDHYRRGPRIHEDPETELRALFARTPDEPLPDLSALPRELITFESPPGTYFDAFPLLVMSREGYEEIARRAPESHFDLGRFRPNLVIDETRGTRPSPGTSSPGTSSPETSSPEIPYPEMGWVGRRLRIGEVMLAVEAKCPRCVMTTHGFGEVPKDPRIMRALVREADGCLGVYARVEVPGCVRVGDAVELIA